MTISRAVSGAVSLALATLAIVAALFVATNGHATDSHDRARITNGEIHVLADPPGTNGEIHVGS